MKYSYKQKTKKLLILFLLLIVRLAATAQVPGTPYGLTTTDCSGAPSNAAITGFTGTYNLNAEFDVTCNATTTGLTLYTWTVPSGLTVVSGNGTKTVRLKGATGGTYNGTVISCTVANACGSVISTAASNVTVRPCEAAPATPGTINFSATTVNLSEQFTASISSVSGATSYVWALPSGLTGTSTTNSITITGTTAGSKAASGITVKAKNDCGESATRAGSGTITVRNCSAAPATPGAITLSATTVNLSGTFTASINTVSNATSYVWTLPSGLTGTSTTNSITITGATAGTYAAGTIKVAAKNDCETSATSNSPAAVSVLINPSSLPDGSGSFAGRTCFDVAQVNNSGECSNLSSRQSETLSANGSRADFTSTTTRNQTYTFTPSGTVSNVRFAYVESGTYTGQIIQSISGGNSGNNISTAVNCNIVYKSDLNGKASGKTNANALTVEIYAVYNDNNTGTGTDRKIRLTAMIRDCACCGAYTTSGTWLSFMCYNLGADETLTTPDQIKNAAQSRTMGSLYQWGKNKAWPATGTVTGWKNTLNTNISGAGGNSSNNAWGSGGNKTAADPCPDGWRVPSRAQFTSIYHSTNMHGPYSDAEVNSWSWWQDTPTRGIQVGYNLFFPVTSGRNEEDGTEWTLKNGADYWSRDIWEYNQNAYMFGGNLGWLYSVQWVTRTRGVAIRCVAE
jgi:uncharacterized protein (TIGR02145 family)